MHNIEHVLSGLAPIFVGDSQSARILDALPVAVYATDADGCITYFNPAAADFWGHRPTLGEDFWCGSFKLFWPDGTPLPHDECPMAISLKTQRPVRGVEAVAERPDGTRVPFVPYPTPFFDSSGALIGAVNMLLDISDRKQSEHAAQHLAAIVESSDDAIISKDLNGTIVSWNKGAERLFGYSGDEIIGKPVTTLIPQERLDEEPGILARIRRGERIDHYETIRQRKDGSRIDISLTVSPVRDGTGRIVGGSKIARDITERKQAAAALDMRVSEQAALYRFTDKLFRAESIDDIYDSALEAILRAVRCDRASILMFDAVDAAGVMRFVRWHNLSEGYRQAVEGHSPWTRDAVNPSPVTLGDIPAADIEESLKRTVTAEGIGALAFIPLMAQGKLIGKFMTYYDRPHAFTGGEIDLALTIASQLGFSIERVRAEQQLRRNEERERIRASELEALMEAVPAAIWIARDPECRVMTGNRTSYEFLKLPADVNPSLAVHNGERPSHFDILVNGNPVPVQSLPVERAARGETVSNFEEEIRFRDGTSRYLLGNAAPLLDKNGKPTGAVAAFVDITARKQAEQQRDLLVAELNHRVKNTLATVVAISHQSFSKGRTSEEAQRSFEQRVRALAHTHGRLAEASWSGVSLEMLLADETAPYCDDRGNVRMAGPEIQLDPKSAVSLGMAFHELTTNAAKYGALSNQDGSVQVSWSVSTDRDLRIRWQEIGGPAVQAPERSGFGRLLLERALRSDLDAEVELEFAPAGLQCVISFPLERFNPSREALAPVTQ
jgi:PAS domain S-box-containing protein